MIEGAPSADDERMVDVRAAGRLVGRSPETVRRWIWSGVLPARREGNRLLVSADDVVAVRSQRAGGATMTLQEWADAARRALVEGPRHSGDSAADLVLSDRRHRGVAGTES